MLMDKINVAEWVSRKISLFGKMQRGRSPSFELFQLDMYALLVTVEWQPSVGSRDDHVISQNGNMVVIEEGEIRVHN